MILVMRDAATVTKAKTVFHPEAIRDDKLCCVLQIREREESAMVEVVLTLHAYINFRQAVTASHEAIYNLLKFLMNSSSMFFNNK